MPAYDYTSYIASPSLYIDFSRLPPPKVIEEIDYEKLLAIYQGRVVSKLPALERATKLEQSPTNVILQTEAYGEMMVRARVNAAARAVMLPFATGSDLDVLAAFYDEPRRALLDDPRNVDAHPEDWEPDAIFRRRVQLSPEAFTTAGSQGSYIYHALRACSDAGVPLRDAAAMRMNNRGGVRIALLGLGEDPTATDRQIAVVTERLYAKNIRPLTDVPSIVAADVFYVDVDAVLTLYPGPDASLVLADVYAALNRLRSRLAVLGNDLTFSALNGALYQEGVQNVKINAPNGDVVAGETGAVWLRTIGVGTASQRMS